MEIVYNSTELSYLFFVYIYLFIGMLYLKIESRLPRVYIGLLLFFVLKMIFDYNKCTFSYIECKARGVKKEQGLIYEFTQNIVDLRKNVIQSYIIYFITLIFALFYFGKFLKV